MSTCHTYRMDLKPFYEEKESGIVIYCGDAMKILPQLGRFDLGLTDPPYGVSGNKKASGQQGKRNKAGYTGNFFIDDADFIRNVAVPVVNILRGCCTGVALTSGYINMMLYPQPDSYGTFYQPSASGFMSWGCSDSQPIFYYGKNPIGSNYRASKLAHVMVHSDRINNDHPCPKPLNEWKKIMVNCSNVGQSIVDPFMGSGTTLVAAKELGRKAVGIEINPDYCAIAVRRLRQKMLL
jgi:DNA modification methylase